ncbi:MAG: phytanoyl-CoA dioxygenase [Herminiimonas sp.]|nr:phytanoyl-CoA dioxygenase [Herminiimonas sp.]MDB5854620.1 phytanoyl-CoA dioxygenase [Herminiimonas sp.]
MSLLPQQLDQFQTDGFLVLKARVTPDRCEAMLGVTLDHLARAVPPIEFEAEVGYPGAPESLDAPGGRTARRLRNAHGRAECFRNWAGEPALVGELAQLLGEDVILSLAHHNCVMTKHPHFGTATGWHRDIRYWSYGRNNLISSWLALGEETTENGALRFIPGSHLLNIKSGQLDDLDFLRPELPENQALFARGVTPTLQAGDVVLFHSGLFHAAGRNETERMKASVVFAYRGKSNPPLPGSRSATAGEVELGGG